VKAIVTGGRGGIGRAIVERAEREGYDVEVLDLVDGFDVTDPRAWEQVGAVDLAFLNAGILTGTSDPRDLSLADYRRAVAVNVDGVVLGVSRLAGVMDRGAPAGGSIVVTASLAGLTAMPGDPVYSLTKHALVGYVRSVAPHLAPIRINAVCPGIADTSMIDRSRAALAEADFPLLTPEQVAEGAWRAAASPGTGEAWFVQPGREPAPFRFPSVPGPRADGFPVGPPPG
jgi:NAD(P)-dependent dehydrogenase (short-subunit alcohol dehydrogenase family)